MIRAVLFDYDGVLSVTSNKSSLSDAIASFYGTRIGWDKLDSLHKQLSLGIMTANEFFQALAKVHHSSKVLTEQEWNTAFKDVFERSELMYSCVAKLRQHGLHTGVLSNSYTMTAHALRQHGNYDGFDLVILSCDVGMMKPDREIYELAIRKLALPAAEILYVDDRENCLIPARELGMQTVLATTPEQTVEAIEQLITHENGAAL